MQQSDEAATTRTATLLGLDQSDQTILPATPTVEDLQNVLSRVQREGLAANPAVLQVRFTQSALGVTDVEGAGIAVRTSEDLQQLNASAAANPYLADDFEAKAFMWGDGDQLFASAAGVAQAGALLEPPARSELLQATNGQNEDAFLDLTSGWIGFARGSTTRSAEPSPIWRLAQGSLSAVVTAGASCHG